MSDYSSNFETATFQPDVDAAISTRNEVEATAWCGAQIDSRKTKPFVRGFSDGWADVLKKFQSWILDPDSIVDEEFESPTPRAFGVAVELIPLMKQLNFDAPKWTMPSGDGGICFEWKDNSMFRRIRIGNNGTVLLVVIDGDKVMQKQLR